MKSKSLYKLLIFIGILLLFGAGTYYLYYNPVGYIGIDINPSIQLVTNRWGNVIDVVPLNEEADILTSDLDFKNSKVDDAINKIVESSEAIGYIDDLSLDNIIVLSVLSENEAKIENDLYMEINEYLNNNKIYALLLFDKNNIERENKANYYGISYSKMLIVQKALVINQTLEPEALARDKTYNIIKRIKQARETIMSKEMLIDRKKELMKLHDEEYQIKVEELCDIIREGYSYLDEEEVVAVEKEKIRLQIKEIKDQLQGDWINQVDNLNGDVNPLIIYKITDLKDKWSLAK